MFKSFAVLHSGVKVYSFRVPVRLVVCDLPFHTWPDWFLQMWVLEHCYFDCFVRLRLCGCKSLHYLEMDSCWCSVSWLEGKQILYSYIIFVVIEAHESSTCMLFVAWLYYCYSCINNFFHVYILNIVCNSGYFNSKRNSEKNFWILKAIFYFLKTENPMGNSNYVNTIRPPSPSIKSLAAALLFG